MIHVPGTVSELPFSVPSDVCCNCGRRSRTELVPVKLKHTRYLLLAGVEWTFGMSLPFCSACKGSANRLRQGLFSKALLVFGAFWVVLGVALFVPTEKMPSALGEHLVATSAVLSILLGAAYFLTRRASAPKTSYYQPVYLKGLDQAFNGDVRAIKLGFTNAAYAEMFRSMNQTMCEAETLQISVAQPAHAANTRRN